MGKDIVLTVVSLTLYYPTRPNFQLGVLVLVGNGMTSRRQLCSEKGLIPHKSSIEMMIMYVYDTFLLAFIRFQPLFHIIHFTSM